MHACMHVCVCVYVCCKLNLVLGGDASLIALDAQAPLALPLRRDVAQLKVGAWNEDRRTGDTLYGKVTIDLATVVQALHDLQKEMMEKKKPSGTKSKNGARGKGGKKAFGENPSTSTGAAQNTSAKLDGPVEIRRVYRLEGNPLLKVSPTLNLAFSIPFEKQLLEDKNSKAAQNVDEVEAMKRKLRQFKAQQNAIMRLSKPTRGYQDHNKSTNQSRSHGGSGYSYAKPGQQLQVPPTFRTKMFVGCMHLLWGLWFVFFSLRDMSLESVVFVLIGMAHARLSGTPKNK